MVNMNNLPVPEYAEDHMSELKTRKKALMKKDMRNFYERSTNHALMVEREYKEKGKDARQYKAFHILIGSTTDNNSSPYDDFPEPEYSIEKFIEKTEKDYESKTKA